MEVVPCDLFELAWWRRGRASVAALLGKIGVRDSALRSRHSTQQRRDPFSRGPIATGFTPPQRNSRAQTIRCARLGGIVMCNRLAVHSGRGRIGQATVSRAKNGLMNKQPAEAQITFAAGQAAGVGIGQGFMGTLGLALGRGVFYTVANAGVCESYIIAPAA